MPCLPCRSLVCRPLKQSQPAFVWLAVLLVNARRGLQLREECGMAHELRQGKGLCDTKGNLRDVTYGDAFHLAQNSTMAGLAYSGLYLTGQSHLNCKSSLAGRCFVGVDIVEVSFAACFCVSVCLFQAHTTGPGKPDVIIQNVP